MVLNANIALSGQNIDTATPLKLFQDRQRQEKQDARQVEQDKIDNDLKLQEAASVRIKNMSAREKVRLQSSVIGAAQLDGFLQADDTEGARNFLKKRKTELGRRIAAGEDIDTTETDDALRLLDSDPETLKGITGQSIRLGQLTGILENIDGKNKGGATGELIDRLVKEGSVKTVAEGLSLIKGAANKLLTFNDEGNLVPIKGAPAATGAVAAGESAGKERGKLEERLKLEPTVVEAIEIAKQVGKGKGEAKTKLNSMVAQFPKLEAVTKKLSALGKKATFTIAGKGADAVAKEVFGSSTEGSIARKSYISTVNNEVLPLLRQTFGAAFTAAEGESLKATLGDPDATPEEKDAVLAAFIASKAAEIDALKIEAGESGSVLSPEKQARLDELRKKREEGTIE